MGEFKIEKGVLVKYTGIEGSVVVPDGVTTIGREAFSFHFLNAEIQFPDSVTELEECAFMNNNSLTGTVVIPKGVTVIRENTFYGCSKIKKIVLPHGLTTIENNAFRKCYSLSEIAIPATVTDISPTAFAESSDIKEFKVEENNPVYKSVDGNLYTKDGKTLLNYAIGKNTEKFSIPEGVKELGAYSFFQCYLTDVIIPEGVTKIGESAFRNCQYLSNVTLPKSLKIIDNNAFREAVVKDMDIPVGTERVGDMAFHKCRNIQRIVIPYTVNHLGTMAFPSCNTNTVLELSPENPHFKMVDGILYSADGTRLITAVSAKALTETVIPDGVREIDGYAFASANELTQVVIPEGVMSIGEAAFCKCKKLPEIALPSSLKMIAKNAFSTCHALTEAVIPEGVEYIGSNAFYDCESLRKAVIPDSINQINGYIFVYCKLIKEIHINLKKAYLLDRYGVNFHITAAVIRTALTRYFNNSLSDEEGVIMQKIISRKLTEATEHLYNYPPFMQFVTEKNIMNAELSEALMKNDKLCTECRALLINYLRSLSKDRDPNEYKL